MCGIVGYIGNKNACDIILDGLSRLEYRGYDSSGVAIISDKKIKYEKCQGRLQILKDKLEKDNINGNCGIGHTRWATHGVPSDINAHPHLNKDKSIAVVHNGIIENYSQLKELLTSKGYELISQTDTEVVPHLIDMNYNGSLIDSVFKTIPMLKGSYALGIICDKNPNELVAVRQDSPLIVGVGDNEYYIASDVPAILNYTRNIYFLENGEAVHIHNNEIDIYNKDFKIIKKDLFVVDWDIEAASKGGYDCFMNKEIHEQPNALTETFSRRLKNNEIILDSISLDNKDLENINKIFIVGCGTAYNAGVIGKYALEALLKRPVQTSIASEFRYNNNFVDKHSLVILISQSGETADTLAVLRSCKDKGARILAITNVVGSSIAREAHDVFYTWAGPEIAVASTKAYTTQILALYMITLNLALVSNNISKSEYNNKIQEILSLPEKIQNIFNNEDYIKSVTKLLINSKNAFYLGRGVDYSLAKEGALKLKEIAYIHSEAFPAGELKHGTIALIEQGTPVIGIMTNESLIDKMISNLEEVKARGAYIISITFDDNTKAKDISDAVITIPKSNDIGNVILSAIPLQLIAYYSASSLGLDVDKPRNLAKSVTVE